MSRKEKADASKVTRDDVMLFTDEILQLLTPDLSPL
jgi:hypothetical protein